MSGKRKRTESSKGLSRADSLLAQLDALSGPSSQPSPVRTPAAKRQKVAALPSETAPPIAKAAPSTAVSARSSSKASPSIQAGPSQASPSKLKVPASPTKGKKKKDEEKRPGRYRSRCPVAILERLERVLSQRFYMVDRRRNDGELREQFSVLGSTGNVYTVTIGPKPSCDCPDALKGNHCKHIIFVFIKVLQVPQSSELWYQSGLLSSELESIFNSAPTAPRASAKHIQDAYDRATGKVEKQAESSTTANKMPEEGDDCAICYDGMHGQAASALVWCRVCKNALHKECFNQYKSSEMGRGKRSVNCVYCRSEWPISSPAGGSGGARRTSEGYLNLADATTKARPEAQDARLDMVDAIMGPAEDITEE
ncbi:hypothetical protein K523DRAFT_342779 [Schizophyllum commune Tattone D]|nr:hypothetical protein K523DRAFT_342779 [Schizophyllum commune Tattone D]